MNEQLCACGRLLHYTDPKLQAAVEALIDRLGPCVPVTTQRGTFMVPRHFIALHGLSESEVEHVAGKYGFERVMRSATNPKARHTTSERST